MTTAPLSLPRAAFLLTGVCLPVVLGGCSSPGAPTTSVVAARPTSPSNGSAFSYYSQPVTLVIANGVTTGSGPVTTIVDVATDAAFTSMITTRTVSPDATGRLTITLDHLSPGTTYWRVKTSAGDNPGTASATQSFSIGPQLIIQPPTPIQPLADTFPHKRPTFTVKNAARTGPPATLAYRFEIASESGFTSTVASGTVAETPTQTSFTPTSDLMPGQTYYWRVRAIDAATAVKSDFAVQGFSTVMPDDGDYRYDLLVQIPPSCPSYLTQPIREFRFDDNLAVNGEHLRFALPRLDQLLQFAVEIERAGERLSGTIGGVANLGVASFHIWRTLSDFINTRFPRQPTSPVPTFTGSTDNKGRLTGTFDGSVATRVCCDEFVWCIEGTGLTWTLTPHR